MPNYRAMTRRAARRHGLDPVLFERQIGAESNFQVGARSSAGAQGIAQIMPATASAWGVDPNDPRQALDAAAKNMARYVRQFGSFSKALRAYNAGPGAVEKSKGYAETNAYVSKIMGGRSDQRQVGGGRAGGGGARRGTTTQIATRLNPNTSVLPALGTLASARQTRQLSAPAATTFAAKAPLPAGYMDNSVSTGSIQSTRQTGSSLQDMIEQIGSGSPVDPIRQTTTRAYRYGGGRGQPAQGGPVVARATKRANTFERKGFAYEWGGGHGGKLARGRDFVPVDCSGAVSAVLGINPRVSGQFASWGKPGDSGRKGITVYANDTHVLMKINGKFFGTSASNRGGGAGWIEAKPDKGYLSNFTARHL